MCSNKIELEGGCHCGAVRYKITTFPSATILSCNCSMCRRTGFIHLIVDSKNFTLIQGEQELTCYQFNTKVAKHYFCKHCGVKSFYVPRSHPNGFSVNVNCLDNLNNTHFKLENFNGDQWEQNIESIR